MAAPQGLLDIPMKPSMPGEAPVPTAPPPSTEPLIKGKEYNAPPSQLSGGTWERLSPGQFMYHPSEEDLALPDLPGHFAEIEVVGDSLLMPNGDLYEGGIEHDIDGDGTMDAPTHFGSKKEGGEEPEPDGDESGEDVVKNKDLSRIGVPPGNSWQDKPGPSIMPIKTKKPY